VFAHADYKFTLITLESIHQNCTISMHSLLQAVGYLAQILTILLSIPMISIVKSSSPDIRSILQVDWLHFMETFLFWASIHVQCISFRDAVGSVERGDGLPVSALTKVASFVVQMH
jgi:hypothetical protein